MLTELSFAIMLCGEEALAITALIWEVQKDSGGQSLRSFIIVYDVWITADALVI